MDRPTPQPDPRAVAILGLATATPPTTAQSKAADLARALCASTPDQHRWVTAIYERSGVQRRASVLTTDLPQSDGPDTVARVIDDFYPPPSSPADHGPSTAQRMQRYAQLAPPLAAAAARAALDDARATPLDITHLVTASCTGFVAPGLDFALIRRLNLRPSVQRTHIGFMGCHAAFNALAVARNIVLANPHARVLVCCVELCTLHQPYGFDPQRIVASALFSDGAAAAVVGSAGLLRPDWSLLDTASLLLPDSDDAMTWCIGDNGFEMTLSPRVPDLIRRELRPWLQSWLSERNLALADIHHWLVHPGGPKVLSAVASALNLPDSALAHSRAVLADHGNMSSATILFILNRARPSTAPAVALGFGPGLTAEAMLLA